MARIGNIPKSQLYGGSPHNAFERGPRNAGFEEEATFVDEAAMADAAEAIREVEVETAENNAEPDVQNLNREKLLHMNIDELRVVAKQLDIPDREQITEKSELVAAIQRCL
jgi:hypothetical protein